MIPPSKPTIGLFDSGFGGLTVLRALLPLMPEANYIYLGDTARLPYGSKSHETIARYAVSSAKFLQDQGAELLVIACNTATALALEDIQQAVPIPVIGVIQPGAQAALASSTEREKNGSKKKGVILSGAPERAAGESNGAESKDLRLSSANSEKESVILSGAPEQAAGESNGAQSKDLRLSSANSEKESVILSEAHSAQSKDLRLSSANSEKESVILSEAHSAESKDLHFSAQPQVLVLAHPGHSPIPRLHTSPPDPQPRSPRKSLPTPRPPGRRRLDQPPRHRRSPQNLPARSPSRSPQRPNPPPRLHPLPTPRVGDPPHPSRPQSSPDHHRLSTRHRPGSSRTLRQRNRRQSPQRNREKLHLLRHRLHRKIRTPRLRLPGPTRNGSAPHRPKGISLRCLSLLLFPLLLPLLLSLSPTNKKVSS